MEQTDPQAGSGARVWCGPDYSKREDDWTYRLSTDDIAALDDAVARFAARDMDVLDIKREQFPLSGFADVLKGIEVDLQDGLGFKIVRGVPVERYDIREAAIAYFGICSHLGEASRRMLPATHWVTSAILALIRRCRPPEVIKAPIN